MRSKLTASFLIVMVYINFIGPLILRVDQQGVRRPARNLGFWSKMGRILQIVGGLAVILLGVAIIVAGFYYLGGMWMCPELLKSVIGFGALVCFVGVFIIGDAIDKWNKRLLTQQDESTPTEEQIAIMNKIKDGMRAKGQLTNQPEIVHGKKTEKGILERATLDAKDKLRKVGLWKDYITTPVRPRPQDSVRKDARSFIAMELEEQIKVKKDISLAAGKNPNPAAAYKEIEGMRYSSQKARLERIINLTAGENYRRRKWEVSSNYMYERYKDEMDPLIKVLNNKKSPQPERDAAMKKYDEISKRDKFRSTSPEEAQARSEEYTRELLNNGAWDRDFGMTFFRGYNRAAGNILILMDKMKLKRIQKYDPTFYAESKDDIEKAQDTISKSQDRLMTGNTID